MNQDNGGVIGKINTPTTSLASGVWSLDSQFDSQSSSIWPLAFPQTTIANSCRFDDSSGGTGDYLEKNFSSTQDSRRTFTVSAWVKRSNLTGTDQRYWGSSEGSGEGYNSLGFDGSNQLKVLSGNTTNSGTQLNFASNAVFRDTSAWYHIVYAVDTTQSTESDRVKIYVNGSQITSFGTATYPSQNTDLLTSTTPQMTIGMRDLRGTNANLFDGYLAEFIFVDNQQLLPTSFGAFNPITNIWEPIGYAGTYGTNGFRLDFADSSALGNDVSGNDNDFSVNSLTSIDQSTDTCSNNFATLNLLATNTNTSNSNFSEGNLELGPNSSSTWIGCTNTIGVTSGKWYAEYKIIEAGSSQNGIMVGVTNSDLSDFQDGASDLSQTGEFGLNYYAAGTINHNGSGIATYTAMSDGDIVQIALDVDNGKVYWGRNGTYENSGDPTSGSTGTGAQNLSLITTGGTYNLHLCCRNTGNAQANYGNPPYSISSGNADANGHGNFEYAPPSGYFALCTKNLAEFGG